MMLISQDESLVAGAVVRDAAVPDRQRSAALLQQPHGSPGPRVLKRRWVLYHIRSMLAEEDIERLWNAFLEHPSVYYVAKHCEVASATVRRYRLLRYRDERLRSIRRRACALAADKNTALTPRKSGTAVQDIRMKIVDDIEERIKAGTYAPSVRDYDRLVRLEWHLRGLDPDRSVPPSPGICVPAGLPADNGSSCK
jgi:hypothetical protein